MDLDFFIVLFESGVLDEVFKSLLGVSTRNHDKRVHLEIHFPIVVFAEPHGLVFRSIEFLERRVHRTGTHVTFEHAAAQDGVRGRIEPTHVIILRLFETVHPRDICHPTKCNGIQRRSVYVDPKSGARQCVNPIRRHPVRCQVETRNDRDFTVDGCPLQPMTDDATACIGQDVGRTNLSGAKTDDIGNYIIVM
eukprot:366405-Chlamydomonas_euryale.AAC.5